MSGRTINYLSDKETGGKRTELQRRFLLVEIKVPPDISSGNAANATREKRPAPAGKSEYNILTIGNLNRDGVTKYACFCRENSIFATSLNIRAADKIGCNRKFLPFVWWQYRKRLHGYSNDRGHLQQRAFYFPKH